jgi:cation transport regulator ChaC
MYYFAYGSNMDEEDLKTWCKNKSKSFPQWKLLGTACLENYRLAFNYYSSGRNGGAANLMESQNSRVYGLLFEMSESDRETIREKEGFPNYYVEITITVKHRDNTISDVTTYKVVKNKEKIEHQKPSRSYMGLILKNAYNNKFPDEYIRYLESIETQ